MQQAQNVAVPICVDLDSEGPEIFTVGLSRALNAVIARATGTGEIR